MKATFGTPDFYQRLRVGWWVAGVVSLILWAAPAAAQSGSALTYTFTTLAGGANVAGNVDGVGNNARFAGPKCIAVDSAGTLYVADTDNHTIRKITAAGVVSTLAGLAGSAGSADGPGSNARFFNPTGIAVDHEGTLYVTDTGNHTIRKITTVGVVSTLAGLAMTSGDDDGTSDNARFYSPHGIAVDGAGNLFVTANHAIRKITTTGIVSTLAGLAGHEGNNDGTGSDSRFNGPLGIAVDSGGTLYVADTDNDTIRKITAAGVVSTIAGSAGNYGSADGTGSNAQFAYPSGIAVDSAGSLYVADTSNGTIRKLTAGGVVSTLAGSVESSDSADGTGSNARFSFPNGIAVDSGGALFVADTSNNTIRTITPAGVVSTLAGSAKNDGSADGTGRDARFSEPQGVAVDNGSILYVADSNNNTIRRVTSAGVVSTLAGLAGSSGASDGVGDTARFNHPVGITVDNWSTLYLTDFSNHTIRKVTSAGIVSTLAGLAESAGSADGTGKDARFNGPSGIAVDSGGTLYVADYDNHSIRKITSAGVVSTIAGLAGSAGSADGTSTTARFNHPFGIAVDSRGNLYVADRFNHTIRKVSPAGIVSTLAGSVGRSGSSDGTGNRARFAYPSGITVDSEGTLYVVDEKNRSIRKVTSAGTVSTLGVSAGSSGSVDSTGSDARFNRPSYIAVDSAGTLYVTDTGNHAIRKGVFTQYGVASRVPNPVPAMDGQLTVTLLPPEAHGQWRFPWEFGWHNSGDTVANLVAGNYPLEFRNVPGRLSLSLPPVQVTSGVTTSVTNTYYPTIGDDDTLGAACTLTVFLGPTPPAGAGWRFLGDTGPFLRSGFATNLLPSTYLIEFATVAGRVKPPSQAVEVGAGTPFTLAVNYPLAATPPAGVFRPFPVPVDKVTDVTQSPFGFVGQLQSDTGYGSGVAVSTNVVLTAAHLVFNDQTLAYVSRAHWFSRREAGVIEPLPQAARAFYVQSGYANQRTNDLASGYSPEQSTPPSRNLDVAALYFGQPVAGGGYAGYLPSDAVPNTWLTGNTLKLLAGYPVDGSQFGDASIVPGTMYQTEPQPYSLSLAPDPVPGQSQTYLAPWFLSYPGNSGGPLFVQLNDDYYPAAVYLGTLFSGDRPYASVVRAIDTNVVNLITQAAALGDNGTNYTGGGVIRFVGTASGAARSVQFLTVNFLPPAIAAQARWKLPTIGSSFLGTNGQSYALLAPTNFVVAFTDVPGYATPTNFPVTLVAGQNAVLDVTYVPAVVTPPVLSTSPAHDLLVSGTAGTQVQLQFRTRLDLGAWADEPGKIFTLGASSVTVLTPAAGAARPGFYRVVVLP